MLILICGLPGTGKSTIARYIRDKINAMVLRTDVIRKDTIKNPKYSEEEKNKVYEELFGMAEEALKNGKNVIIDGTFFKKSLRERIVKIANGKGMKIIECTSPEEVIRERISGGRKDESDADFKIYEKIRKQWEPVEEDHIILDTSGDWKKEIDSIF
ncbi:MAG: AAA family ATPase [Candidatus Aenigmarchaeota archaeon]|nr:AAA family ATPase [Candidatus Aenigmarchaeota archaeon]